MKPRAVLVTGASRGLGFALTNHFLQSDSPPEFLFAACRDPTGATALQALASTHSNLYVIQLNVRNENDIKNAFDQVKTILGDRGLNLLINCAGILSKASLEEVTVDVLMEQFLTNSISPLTVTKAFLPLLQQAAKVCADTEGMSCTRAAVISLGSILGSLGLHGGNFKNWYAYRMSKAALHMFTRCLSVDVKDDGILVAVFHPGSVRTDMGGPQGEISIEESITGMTTLMSNLNESHHGLLLSYKGNSMPL